LRGQEKLIQYGPDRLSNSELLAILLRSGNKGENVISLSNRVLKRFKADNLATLLLYPKAGILALKSRNCYK
jgi:DNA repair protein RadC